MLELYSKNENEQPERIREKLTEIAEIKPVFDENGRVKLQKTPLKVVLIDPNLLKQKPIDDVPIRAKAAMKDLVNLKYQLARQKEKEAKDASKRRILFLKQKRILDIHN